MSEDEIKTGKEWPEGEELDESCKGTEVTDEESEVTGQGRCINLRCYYCCAINRTNTSWSGFWCWNCRRKTYH